MVLERRKTNNSFFLIQIINWIAFGPVGLLSKLLVTSYLSSRVYFAARRAKTMG